MLHAILIIIIEMSYNIRSGFNGLVQRKHFPLEYKTMIKHEI